MIHEWFLNIFSDRFQELQGTIDPLSMIGQATPHNTKAKSSWALNVYEEWIRWKTSSMPSVSLQKLSEMSDTDMNTHLAMFIREVKKD